MSQLSPTLDETIAFVQNNFDIPEEAFEGTIKAAQALMDYIYATDVEKLLTANDLNIAANAMLLQPLVIMKVININLLAAMNYPIGLLDTVSLLCDNLECSEYVSVETVGMSDNDIAKFLLLFLYKETLDNSTLDQTSSEMYMGYLANALNLKV